jgi:hypothetical protein
MLLTIGTGGIGYYFAVKFQRKSNGMPSIATIPRLRNIYLILYNLLPSRPYQRGWQGLSFSLFRSAINIIFVVINRLLRKSEYGIKRTCRAYLFNDYIILLYTWKIILYASKYISKRYGQTTFVLPCVYRIAFNRNTIEC